jgi:hypothetical protein
MPMMPLILHPAEIVHDERREQRDPAAVEDAVGKCESGERPKLPRDRPDDHCQRHTDKHRQERKPAPHAVSQAAEKKASGGASDTDHPDKQDGRGLWDAVVHRVGSKMCERDKYPERAEQAGDVEADKPPRLDRFTQGGPHRHRSGARSQRIAVGT